MCASAGRGGAAARVAPGLGFGLDVETSTAVAVRALLLRAAISLYENPENDLRAASRPVTSR